jgi:acyl dehydratase
MGPASRPAGEVVGRYLEDFTVGQVLEPTDEYEMTAERVAAYASEYDPQPIHLDPDAAAHEMFGGIVASGWHSLSVTMRLVVLSQPLGGDPMVGIAIDNLRFLAAVRVGDRLRAQAEVLEVRRSKSQPRRGYLVLRITTRNQDGTPVLTQDWTLLVPLRRLA